MYVAVLFMYQKMSSVSRTHIETGIYFRWDDPDDDSAASSLSTLNDARLGSYVYFDELGVVGNRSGTSCGSGTGRDLDSSSTDGNNNDVSVSSEGRTSLSSQHSAAAAQSQNSQTPVSRFAVD